MSWFGWGGSQAASGVPSAATAAPLSDSDLSSPELKLHSDASFLSSTPLDTTFDSVPAAGPDTVPSTPAFSAPPLALDQIKQAGVPLNRQMTPYLQMDPSIFRASQPQYIMPEGNEHGKGKFEFMLGHIGWAVGGGFFVGCARGFVPELFNKDTRQLSGKPWLTRLVNATAKHGSGYAQPAGTAVFLYSALEIGLKSVRAEDDLNSLGAGALAGAIYRSPHGIKASANGALAGFLLSTLWAIINPDSRQRFREMFNLA
uniref:Mitochondrial import inner membrane translocase subunit TIM23 n=1 Tax=Panagrellus redivivus TaxID=6233 RepID=A0A7E4UZJ4_PANRE